MDSTRCDEQSMIRPSVSCCRRMQWLGSNFICPPFKVGVRDYIMTSLHNDGRQIKVGFTTDHKYSDSTNSQNNKSACFIFDLIMIWYSCCPSIFVKLNSRVIPCISVFSEAGRYWFNFIISPTLLPPIT